MTRRIPTLFALSLAAGAARAHDGLALDGALHHALHAIGSERLAVLAGLAVAVIVGYVVRRAVRRHDAGRVRRQD